MASGAGTEVAHAYVTLLPKTSGNFKQVAESSANDFGNSFKSGLSAVGVAAGQLLASGIQKAIGAIGQYVSEGIAYADALTRFPLVLESLGLSADEAAGSIAKLEEGLKGTPILVSDATTAVQRLVATTGDVEKSTDWFIALNDAVMAGGAPFQVQQAAIEQWQQAVAKGKPDRIEFRSFMQAFPGVMKQVAQELGVTETEMQNMFSKGQLSMEEFNEVLLKLDRDGTEGFKNLKEQARQALVGIDTGVALVKKGLIEGFGGVIKSLNISESMGFFQDIGDNIRTIIDNTFAPAANQMSMVFSDAFNAIPKGLENLRKKSLDAGQFIGQVFANMRNGGFESLGALFQPLIAVLSGVVKVIGEIILKFSEFASKNQELFSFVGNLIAAFSGLSIITPVISGISKGFTALGSAFTNPATLIIVAIGLLVGAFMELYKTNEQFRNTMNETGQSILIAFQPVFQTIQQLWTQLQPVFEMIIQAFADLAMQIAPVIGDMIASLAQPINDILQAIIGLLPSIIPVIQKILDVGIQLITQVINVLAQFLPPLLQAITPLIQTISFAIGQLMPVISTIIENISFLASVIISALTPILPPLIELISNIIQVVSPIISFIAELIGTWLPPVINIIGVVLAGAINILMSAIHTVISIFNSLIGAIAAVGNAWVGFINGLKEVVASIVETWHGFLNMISEGISNLINWFMELPGNILGALGDLGNLLVEAGHNVIEGFINGLKDMAGKIWETISNIFGGAVDFVKSIFGISSPSKVFRYFARMDMQGFAKGLIDGAKIVYRTLEKVTSGFKPSFQMQTPSYAASTRQAAYATNVGYTGGAGQQVNIYFDNAKLNDDMQIRDTATRLLKEISRKEQM